MCILCEIKEALEESQTPNDAYQRISKVMTQFMIETNALVNAVGEHANSVPGEVYSAAEVVARHFEPQEDPETDREDAAEYARQFVEQLNARGIKAVIVNSQQSLVNALAEARENLDNLEAWTPTGKAN